MVSFLDVIYTTATTAIATRKITSTAKKYKILECEDAATAMKDILIKKNQHGEKITLYFPNAHNGIVMSDRYSNKAISENGYHCGIKYNGLVHCNVYPEGLPEGEWISSFYDVLGEEPIVSRFKF